MSWIAAAIGAASAGLGAYQYLHGKKQAKRNVRPMYNIDPAYQSNIDVLKNTIGLPSSALEFYNRNIGQNTNQNLNAILSLGGTSNDVASLYGNQDEAFERVLIQDALQTKSDLGGINNAKLELAEQRDKQFSLNLFDPYKDKAQAAAEEKNAGIQNIFGGLNTVAGGLANRATLKLAESINAAGKEEGVTDTAPNEGVDLHLLYKKWQDSQKPAWQQTKFYDSIPNNSQLNFGDQGSSMFAPDKRANNFFGQNPLPLNMGGNQPPSLANPSSNLSLSNSPYNLNFGNSAFQNFYPYSFYYR